MQISYFGKAQYMNQFSCGKFSSDTRQGLEQVTKRQTRGADVTIRASTSAEGGEKKLWGGRFTEDQDPLMEKFNNSLWLDKRVFMQDIQGSQVYARALCSAKLLTSEEADLIVNGLDKVRGEWERDEFVIRAGDEDIHTANERRLTEIIGDVAGKLHTGRSRNDQVATDMRLYCMAQYQVLYGQLVNLIQQAIARSEQDIDVIMPGFTHLQSAQPVRWSHWLLSHATSWSRDAQRMRDAYPRIAMLPLGSGALAGNPFGVDRSAMARELDMVGGICPNSMDAVADRDYVMEVMFNASVLCGHLSRWAEDLIVYSSGPFGMVACSDAYATGSSLMPQKKNPDALELIRGKAGVMTGRLTGGLCTLKGTPTTYNKDLQEIWPMMFSTIDDLSDIINISTGVLATIKINKDAMLSCLSPDMLATDLAEYLVRKGVPFRQTHHIAGEAVKAAETKGIKLSQLSLEDLQGIHPMFEEDVAKVWDYTESTERRSSEGGTSKAAVQQQIEKLKIFVEKYKGIAPSE